VNDPAAGPLEIEGDGYAAAGEPVTLVRVPAVRDYLHLTPDEARDLDASVVRFRGAVQQVHARKAVTPPRDPDVLAVRRETEREIAARIGAERWQQLLRLSWRIRDADALLDPEVADALRIGAEQRARLEALHAEGEKNASDVLREFSNVRLRSNAPIEARGIEYEHDQHERLRDVLTPAQRAAFDRLKSEVQPWP
jgi:hypothetical protein